MSQSRLTIVPVELKTANEFVRLFHRHYEPLQTHRFSLGVVNECQVLVGCAIVSRPAARMTSSATTVEVARLVTNGTDNACSALYGASARVAKHMGYERIQTFILESETGVSLKASGWDLEVITPGGEWSRPSRIRRDINPTDPKQRWGKILNPPQPSYSLPMPNTEKDFQLSLAYNA